MKKMTIKDLIELKGKRKITLTTAFEYDTAKACEMSGVDIIVAWAHTIGSMAELEIVVKQVRKGAPNTLIGAGIPTRLAYISEEQAVRCALLALEYGADIIYCSGMKTENFKALAERKIPCVGHVGLLPVQETWFGGMRAVGKNWQEAVKVYQDTMAFSDAGAIAVEMECVPHLVAADITRNTNILTFSMGSGKDCDGQFVFSCDILGSHDSHYPRHSKKYCNFYIDSVNALSEYVNDVITGNYPERCHEIEIHESEFSNYCENKLKR